MSFSELLEPQRTGPFRTVAVLGEGGMGRVLLGVSPDGRLVAVKQVHADLADDEFRARFRREVAASRRASGASTTQPLYNLVHTEPGLTAFAGRVAAVVEPCFAKYPAARPPRRG